MRFQYDARPRVSHKWCVIAAEAVTCSHRYTTRFILEFFATNIQTMRKGGGAVTVRSLSLLHQPVCPIANTHVHILSNTAAAAAAQIGTSVRARVFNAGLLFASGRS
jgi:hypothetical protein